MPSKMVTIPNNIPIGDTPMHLLDYAHSPHLTDNLTEHLKRVLKLPVLPPRFATEKLRSALGTRSLALPMIPKKTNAIVTLLQTDDIPPFHFNPSHVKATIGPTVVNAWDYSIVTAQVAGPVGIHDIELRELSPDHDLTSAESAGRYQLIVQQDWYAAALLESFKQKMRKHTPALTVPEAQLVANTRVSTVIAHFIETHVLWRRATQTSHDKHYLLQEPIDSSHMPTVTSTTCFEPPEHEGASSMVDFLYAFTHFTYEHHDRRALLYGFQASGNTIYASNILDRDYSSIYAALRMNSKPPHSSCSEKLPKARGALRMNSNNVARVNAPKKFKDQASNHL
ncbi:uncharacterized protein MELLADRAFT_103702 [Melampsora larici-populina 98AG31]|uniref:Alpha-type protein kinase domain-containing protein n=1 Tax=Melampsora larici-populina (strain 98AG31 / pathotype 3-4-7) TaxID=747676 RepID=F4RCP1_MELLP|nr:uncharacterized protein MELLADRAFT_103702 [Melampsora larici-populina 98AG31]EGG09666.1 hypothetical protein MELLADRAFT_103702 [Melampsora larici-populina 98AG31]